MGARFASGSGPIAIWVDNQTLVKPYKEAFSTLKYVLVDAFHVRNRCVKGAGVCVVMGCGMRLYPVQLRGSI